MFCFLDWGILIFSYFSDFYFSDFQLFDVIAAKTRIGYKVNPELVLLCSDDCCDFGTQLTPLQFCLRLACIL